MINIFFLINMRHVYMDQPVDVIHTISNSHKNQYFKLRHISLIDSSWDNDSRAYTHVFAPAGQLTFFGNCSHIRHLGIQDGRQIVESKLTDFDKILFFC